MGVGEEVIAKRNHDVRATVYDVKQLVLATAHCLALVSVIKLICDPLR